MFKVGDRVKVKSSGNVGVVSKYDPTSPNPYGILIKEARFPDFPYWFSDKELEPEILELTILEERPPVAGDRHMQPPTEEFITFSPSWEWEKIYGA